MELSEVLYQNTYGWSFTGTAVRTVEEECTVEVGGKRLYEGQGLLHSGVGLYSYLSISPLLSMSPSLTIAYYKSIPEYELIPEYKPTPEYELIPEYKPTPEYEPMHP